MKQISGERLQDRLVLVKVPNGQFIFPPRPLEWEFLIAPFPGHCLLVTKCDISVHFHMQ